METSGNRQNAKFQRKTLTVEEARDALTRRVRLLPSERVGLLEAVGRRLAEPVKTSEPLPHFRRSGMDGFAVRFADVADASPRRPVELEVVERLPAGQEPIRPIAAGTGARIMTGGIVPDGADAVIMFEMAEEIERAGRTFVRIRKPIAQGANITPIGEEAAADTPVLEAGAVIGAGQAAILAALGCARVEVFRKPIVTVVSTGTELLRVEEPLQPGKIRNSNAYMLAAQIAAAGGQPRLAGSIPDDSALAERTIGELLHSDADLIVTTGGVSVGDYDRMADFFLKWEGTTLFTKIAMRPGSPTSAGVWGDKFLIGLSGNPSACFVGFELFVRPVLAGMQGGKAEAGRTFTAVLAADYTKANGYTRYVRGRWYSRNGIHYVEPVGPDKSSAMLSLKEADCLIVIPPTKTGVAAGEVVEAILLGDIAFA